MKNYFLLLIAFILNFNIIAQSEESETGLPGDNFSLEGALELFKNASSPEDFEKQLNSEKNHVNNLDLNGDGDIDYIRVISKVDKEAHLLILQVPVSETENQDIAVIEIEKTSKDEAILQIIGDEDIFGEEIIVEPSDGTDIDEDDGGKGPMYENEDAYVVVNVWGWSTVRYIYAPAYRPWISPWRWRSYPTWWSPWRPFSWSVWHPFRVRHYRPTVRIVSTHRVVRAHNVYRPARVTSTTVRTRHAGAHANYKVNRTKTKVTGPRGNSVTKKTTTVRGQKGQVKAQRTTVKKGRKG
ncbi:MAG: hypothetical protein IPK35_17770 [Saprospiraceae bacterium]|nr:hypothetical protein [Saprospiraceae bacterium]